LGGTLDVALINGFVPPSDSSFTVVQSGGTVNGVFSATNLPAAQPMTTSYLASMVNVTAAQPTVPDQITNPQIDSSNDSPPNSEVVLGGPGTPTSAGPNVTNIYLETTTGQIVPLIPASTIEPGSYVNLDTGQTVILTSGTTLEPGIYLDPVTQTVFVVTIDEVTGQLVIMTASVQGAQIASDKGVQVGKMGACR
ncbi:MAG TPA: hypothetical protein VFO57_04355, partial [Burkholderiales bacterium]|nr:hypothetical protein [Burkholderiales bacterium]